MPARKGPPRMKLPVVYTMGKVASSSIAQAIVRAERTVHDIHTLDRAHLVKMAKARLAHGKYPPYHVCVTMAYESEILDRSNCIYISLVREPIARNLSAYFQNLATLGGSIGPDRTPESVVAAFLKRYPHGFPAHWFDREFKRFLGINVYDEPFDKVHGSVLTDQVLIMRTDLEDAEKGRLLSAALGTEISVPRRNMAENKGYASAYQAVLEAAKFPAPFVNSIYSTPFARHFWTDDELRKFRDRWTAASGKTFVSIDEAVRSPAQPASSP